MKRFAVPDKTVDVVRHLEKLPEEAIEELKRGRTNLSRSSLASRAAGSFNVLSAVLILLFITGCTMKFYVVEVGGSKKPLFPDACVICGMPGTERLIMTDTSDDGSRVDLYLYGLPFKAAQGPQIEVPIHDSCAKGIRNTFLKQAAAAILGAAFIFGILCIHAKRPGVGLIAAVALLSAFFIIQALKKMPFEFRRYREKYVMMFGDRAYAEKVADLNRAQVRIGTDPATGR